MQSGVLPYCLDCGESLDRGPSQRAPSLLESPGFALVVLALSAAGVTLVLFIAAS